SGSTYVYPPIVIEHGVCLDYGSESHSSTGSLFVGSTVTVNSGQKDGIGGRVYVTALPSHGPTIISGSGPTLIPHFSPRQTPATSRAAAPTLQSPLALLKLLLKAVSKTTKKSKVFTLRDVKVNNVTSVEILKQIIKNQLTHDITSDFDVGYIQGTNIISIRGEKYLNDIWGGVQKQGAAALLWCDGLKVKSEKWKKSNVDTSFSDDDVVVKPKKISDYAMKQKAVMKTFNELQDKHGGTDTQVQYRIWSEIINGGMYSSLFNPPNTSTFQRARGFDRKGSASASVSPSKSIDVRSKCYKQLSELSTLTKNGILTVEEFEKEKKAIMLTLNDLN
uniref:SHOCT domain-containing protein n=1 Tax=Amphimedon queenslandica TaxID=400682 RepID=A0A1X7UJH2_AMPQE